MNDKWRCEYCDQLLSDNEKHQAHGECAEYLKTRVVELEKTRNDYADRIVDAMERCVKAGKERDQLELSIKDIDDMNTATTNVLVDQLNAANKVVEAARALYFNDPFQGREQKNYDKLEDVLAEYGKAKKA